jgi:uncharacterized protein (DUF58 family)
LLEYCNSGFVKTIAITIVQLSPLLLLLLVLLLQPSLLLLMLMLLLVLLLAFSDADVEVLFDTVDVFARCEGRVRRLVVDQLAAVRRRPVLQQEQSVES